MIEDYLSLLNVVTRGVGITAFFVSIAAAAALVYINNQKRIDLSLPGGNSVPWTVVVIGGGFLTLGVAGIEGLAIAIGAGIFTPVVKGRLEDYLKSQK